MIESDGVSLVQVLVFENQYLDQAYPVRLNHSIGADRSLFWPYRI
jgi:hypothetical protein